MPHRLGMSISGFVITIVGLAYRSYFANLLVPKAVSNYVGFEAASLT
jgi:hypothetical protein